ncbi:MAG: type I polyketide synthase [Chloroflexi bacterium]|nr:type I polyketide synthase [Chloroflexota bacterium]
MMASDPIAIVGMSCRLPGAADPDALWTLLRDGVEAIGDAPSDRVTGIARGGFLASVDEFDADFFRISPREATAMDPQQRLALELSWESLEDAAIVPDDARATVGVFLGVMAGDYAHVLAAAGRRAVTHHTLTGQGRALIANRISYALGFHGPSLTVDTGQSSSLVAVHLACESLRQDECAMALAGGVNLILSPLSSQAAAHFGALSPDGRCYAWDERANGHVRGEGGGVVVLKRLSDAVAHGDRIYGVVRSSAVGTGSGEGGLTVPSTNAQQRVMGQALGRGAVAPSDVQYVELHGTGTSVGDPIEARSVGGVYGSGRTNGDRLAVGTVKTNLGHLEGAAGIAGLIKTALCVHHGELVASLNFARPNPNIPLDELGVRVVDCTEPWPAAEGPRRAGVSSFGMGGANCHLVLEQAPGRADEEAIDAAPLPAVPLLLSATSEAALRAQAGRLHAHLQAHPRLATIDAAYSLACGRTPLEQRAAVIGGDRPQLLDGLAALMTGEPADDVVHGSARPGRTVFTFPGQGAQWEGMAVELLDSSPVFAASIEACEEALSAFVDWSLTDVLRGVTGAPTLERVDVVQPALFAVMVSLAALWCSYGVAPSAVIGHSQGEIAAAYVAGGLSLQDAARIVALRSRAVADELAGCGGMASLALAADAVEERIGRWNGRLSIAAVNGPSAVVVSGDFEALDELLAELDGGGVWVRKVPVDYPSHSKAVERLRERLLRDLAPIEPRAGDVAFFSTARAEIVDCAQLDAEYWYRGLRDRVRFEEATRALIDDGASAFVEMSPHPVLTSAVQATIDAAGAADRAVAVGSLRRGDGGLRRFTASLAQAHVRGCPVEWRRLFAGRGARRTQLPTYAFQRERFWLEAESAPGDLRAAGLEPADHPLLGAGIRMAGGGDWLFTGRLSLATHPWLRDHVVLETILLPGSAYVELALRAARQVGRQTVEQLTLHAPLGIPEHGAVQLQVVVGEADDDDRCAISIYARPDQTLSGAPQLDAQWIRHASGTLAHGPVADALADRLGGQAWPPPDAEPLDVESLYERLAASGLSYGPSFARLRAAWRRGGEVFAEVALDEQSADEAPMFAVHPILLNTALHPCLAAASGRGLWVPSSWHGVRLLGDPAAALRVHVAPLGEDEFRLTALDPGGAPVLVVDSAVTRRLEQGDLDGACRVQHDSLFGLRWVEVSSPAVYGAARIALHDCYDDVAAMLDDGDAPDGVVLAVSGGDPLDGAAGALELVQRWLGDDRAARSRLVLVTRGAVAVDDDELPDPAGAAAWGLVRSAQSEHPGRFVLVDVDDDLDIGRWAALLASGEPQVAMRRGRACAPRLSRVPVPAPTAAPLDPDGTVLVTGGTGVIGAIVAQHLAARHGIRHLLLVTRPDAPDARALVDELAGLDCEATVVACDPADRDQLAAAIAAIPADRPLRAIVHAAGPMQAATAEALSRRELARVMRPKVDMARHLHELTRDCDLSAFVLFSSVAATIGSPGHGASAAANAALEALAEERRVLGLPGQVLAWGVWAETAETAAGGEADEVARRLGIMPVTTRQWRELLDVALASRDRRVMPVRLDTTAVRALAQAGMLPPLLASVLRVAPAEQRADVRSLPRRLASVPKDEREAAVLDVVRGQAASVLGRESAAAVDPERRFKDLGFDSLTAVALRNCLTQVTGVRLPSTLIFDHPTPVAVAAFLVRELAQPGGQADTAGGDREIRRMLASIPIGRLRDAGLLDRIVDLASSVERGADERAADEAADIDEMDLDDLVRLTFETNDRAMES